MTPDTLIGPSRVLLLNCGKFDFAEIELDKPLHLVGPNNVGKTSLIALLQLLYIDDQRQMHFAREMSETRRYYFPDVHSFALFECLTPGGFQVVGVHGLGPVRQYDFERFAYTGRLEAGDYLDERRCIRPHEEIFRDLAMREFTRLAPRQLRSALTGVGDNRGVDLRLVPARQTATYERFRKVFNNILRLSHIKQDELKQLLLDIFESEFQERSINLAETYAQGFEKVQKDSREVSDLKQLEKDIQTLLDHIDRRNKCRRILPALWQALGRASTETHSRLNREESSLKEQITCTEKGIIAARKDIEELGRTIASQASRLGELNAYFQRIEEERKRFSDFLPDWAEQRRHDLQGRIDNLAYRLGQSTQSPEKQVQARLQSIESNIKQGRERLKGLAQAAVVWLHERFEHNEMEDLFKLLSPELLALCIKGDDPAASINDEAQIERILRSLLSMRKGSDWCGPGVDINLAALRSPDLKRYRDPETIETELADLEAQAKIHRETLAAARDAAGLRKEKANLEDEREKLVDDLNGYKRLQDEESRLTDWKHEREELTAKQEAQERKRTEREEERLGLVRDIERHRDQLEQIKRKRDELHKAVADLKKPEDDWPMVACEDLPDELDELTARYRRMFEDQRNQQAHVEELLNRIERQTYSRYVRADEESTVRALREQLESIPEREKAVQELWTSIAVGIKTELGNIAHDLDILKGQVQKLNMQIGRVSISNLKSLKVLIQERPDWVRHIRGVSLNEDMPLFANRNAVQQSFDDLGRLLSEHPRIDLEDLFDLQFEVGTPDERTRRHAHLDAIESNGTTITIKVLINLVLLRTLLENANVRIPFYLDECSSLDRDNLAALVQAAQEMGFIAVLASPDAMDAAERIYFINEKNNGRVVLDPESSLVSIMRHGNTANE